MSTHTPPLLSDHLQPVEKNANEDTQMTKQEDIPTFKDDGEKDEKEKPKAENSSSLEIPVTTLYDKETEPPVIVEVEKFNNAPVLDVSIEAGSEGVEISVPEPEASSTVDSAGEAVERQPVQKLVEAVETVPEEKSAPEAVETVPEKKSTPEAVGIVPEEKSAPEAVETVPEKKSAPEAVETVSNEKLAPEAVETVSEKKSAPDAVETVQEEKSAPEAVETVPVEKPAIEAVEQVPEERLAIDDVGNNPEIAAVEASGNELEGKLEMGAVETESKDQPAIEPIEKQSEKKPDTETVEPTSLTEAAHVEDFPGKYSEPEKTKQSKEVAKAECETVEKAELVNELVDKRQEVSQVIEEVVEKIESKPEEYGEGVIMKDQGKKADECEGSISLKEEKVSAGQEPAAIESTVSTNEDAHTDLKEAGKDSSISDVEKAVSEYTNGEASAVDGVNELLKDETMVTGTVEEEKEEKDVKIEKDSEEKNVKIEEVIQSEITKIENMSGSTIVAKVSEKYFEGELGSRDLEVVKEKEENVKEDIPASVESNEDKDVEVKVNEAIVTSTANEPIGEPKVSQLNVKPEETVKAESNELECTKEAADEKKSDPPTLESSKDVDTKTSRDLPMQDVSFKPPQKPSGNLISKVKQSIVKVKKAIIGKSPSSKTLQPEAKADETVK